jgi:F-box/WD-40 domain protein MET30
MVGGILSAAAGSQPVSPAQQALHNHISPNSQMLSPPLTSQTSQDNETNQTDEASHNPQQPSRDNCDRHGPNEDDTVRTVKMPYDLAGKTVTPYLKEHIPGLYAPLGMGKQDNVADSVQPNSRTKDPNTKYCYRHRPDSKCRRAADETKMGVIQRVSTHTRYLLFENQC